MKSLRIRSRRRPMAEPRRSPWRTWRSMAIIIALILLAIGLLPGSGPNGGKEEPGALAQGSGANSGVARVALPLPKPAADGSDAPTASPAKPAEGNSTRATDNGAASAGRPGPGGLASPIATAKPTEAKPTPPAGPAPQPESASAPALAAASAPAPNPAPKTYSTKAVRTDAPPKQMPAQAAAPAPEPQQDWLEVRVKSGDSLSSIFERLDLGNKQMYAVLQAGKKAKDLQRLHPGQQLRFLLGDDKRLEEMVYQRSLTDILRVVREGDRLRVQSESREFEVRTRYARARIENSLFEAGLQAGLSDSVTMQVAEIFAWDIDFALDIRRGDRFRVLYEEKYLDGVKVKDGVVLAVEFTNNGKTYRAIRYTDPKGRSGYYAPDGRSLRKAFLRAPVSFTRISSRFSMGRYHPVLHRIRAHKGVDYAAARGTPVHATGNGKVIFKGRKGGYGNTVILRHGSNYTTLYAHLSRYPRGLRKGQWVKQGQVIGYVGSSGLASGPHLHYEFRVGGKHRNPLTVKLPAAQPIPKAYLADFNRHTKKVLQDLDSAKPTTVALNQAE